jgi:hypothetical protein
MCHGLEFSLEYFKRRLLEVQSVTDMKFRIPGCEGCITYVVNEGSTARYWLKCGESDSDGDSDSGSGSDSDGAGAGAGAGTGAAHSDVSTKAFVDALLEDIQPTMQHWVDTMAAAPPGTTVSTAFVSRTSFPGKGVVVARGPRSVMRMTRLKTTTTIDLFKGTKEERVAARAAAAKAARAARAVKRGRGHGRRA